MMGMSGGDFGSGRFHGSRLLIPTPFHRQSRKTDDCDEQRLNNAWTPLGADDVFQGRRLIHLLLK
jgi:hypothetical protein